MAMAVHSELGDAGFSIWDEWSQGADCYKPKEARATWRSVKPGRVKIGTLIYEAKQRGYLPNGDASRMDDEATRLYIAERADRERREAEAAKQAQERAAKLAEEIYRAAKPAGDDHPYLRRKGIGAAPGVKVGRWYQVNDRGERYREKDNCLLIPLRDRYGRLWNLQAIFPSPDVDLERDKDYLSGGRKQGTYFAIGKAEGALAIGEGFATMQSVRAATGLAVCVAFDKGNLLPVARTLREKFPEARLILVADNDIKAGKSNHGRLKAIEAALAVNGVVAVPELDGRKCDFNDLAQERGHDAVKAAIEKARHPEAATEASNQSAVSDRPAPEKLPELPAVPAFSFDFLPSQLRAFVQDISERMQCPPEFAAVGAIAMAGSAIGRNLGVRPKLADSWTVVPNLWGMLVGKSGLMKSPALSEALKPLERMQAKAFQQYEDAQRDFAITEKAEKIRAADAEARARNALKKDQNVNLKTILRPDDVLVQPKLKRYIVNDSSPEALCETLEDNPQGVLCVRDELIGLLRSMDKEGNQEARALYLTAADGDKSFTVDRIGRGKGRHIESLCVSIIGGIQPGVLASYVRETQRSGAGDDGLLQRFGMMVYPDVKADWQNVDRKPDAQASGQAKELIERLCTLTAEVAGAEAETDGGIPFLRFDSQAYELFIEWLTELEHKLRAGDDHPAINSHLSKYRKLVPALALINHLCEGGRGAITKGALARALLFSEFLEAHARRVYSYAARPDLDAAKTILAKLRGGKLPERFTMRDVYRNGWSGLTSPDEAQAALRVLEDYGYVRAVPDAQDNGRPSRIFEAHPTIKGGA